jgi:hypothetical protein
VLLEGKRQSINAIQRHCSNSQFRFKASDPKTLVLALLNAFSPFAAKKKFPLFVFKPVQAGESVHAFELKPKSR